MNGACVIMMWIPKWSTELQWNDSFNGTVRVVIVQTIFILGTYDDNN